jgi:hypothetical protein
MMWDHVMVRVTALMLADDILIALVGANVRMAGTGDHKVPLIEWSHIGDTQNELWAPISIQFDIWAHTMDDMRAIERRLHQLFNKDLPIDVGGLRMFSVYNDGSMLATPDRSNYEGRAVRFHFTPLREKYAEVS